MEASRIEQVAAYLTEGWGIRKTARLTGASKSGVTRIAIRLGLHARVAHDALVRDLDVAEVQFDEKWAFVGKKQKHCDDSVPDDDDEGDQWDHTAVDVDSGRGTAGSPGSTPTDNRRPLKPPPRTKLPAAAESRRKPRRPRTIVLAGALAVTFAG